jgi:hypothetical protein
MASLWEILDPSALQYDSQRGITYEPGVPPTDDRGWLRTGYFPSGIGGGPGEMNCFAATQSSGAYYGTISFIIPFWTWPAQPTSPWAHEAVLCDTTTRVWCVED